MSHLTFLLTYGGHFCPWVSTCLILSKAWKCSASRVYAKWFNQSSSDGCWSSQLFFASIISKAAVNLFVDRFVRIWGRFGDYISIWQISQRSVKLAVRQHPCPPSQGYSEQKNKNTWESSSCQGHRGRRATQRTRNICSAALFWDRCPQQIVF